MLYVFNNKNSIQIAWNSTLPKTKSQNRKQELDISFGILGFIRTFNGG